MDATEDRSRRRRREFAAAAESWFRVSPLEPGVWLVGEPGHVNSWLIQGSERDVLLDTGLGLADISVAVASVSPRQPGIAASIIKPPPVAPTAPATPKPKVSPATTK